jgi:predicted ATP-dependent serine protease
MFTCGLCASKTEAYAPKCPNCGATFALTEDAPPAPAFAEARPTVDRAQRRTLGPTTEPVLRVRTGLGTLDLAFGQDADGKGIPVEPPSVVIVSGGPGSGKSTLALLCASALRPRGVLYAETEAGEGYFRQLCKRTGVGVGVEMVYTKSIEAIIAETEAAGASILIVDQLHGLEPRHAALDHLKAIAEFTKATGRTLLVVAEQAAAGNVWGGKSLEHAVDVVLGLEVPSTPTGEPVPERADGFEERSLRVWKNRYGVGGGRRYRLLLGPVGWAEWSPEASSAPDA